MIFGALLLLATVDTAARCSSARCRVSRWLLRASDLATAIASLAAADYRGNISAGQGSSLVHFVRS